MLVVASGLTLLPIAPASATTGVSSFVCGSNTVYTVSGSSSFGIDKVNALTGAASDNGNFSADNDDAVNALALPAGGGRYIYAFNRSTNKVLRFDATTSSTSSYTAPSNSEASSVVAGAINPATGIYYYASGGSTWTVNAFNTNTNTAIGKVATISGTGLSGNGDFAFDALGNLYVVSNANSTAAGTLARVNEAIPTTAGSAALTITVLTNTPDDSGQYHSMAFDSSGALVIGSGSGKVIRVNPSTGAIISSVTTGTSFADMASCALPSTASANVNLPSGRYASTDQFTVSITGNGVTSGNTGTTAGTDTGLQSNTAEVAGPVVVLPSSSYTITQTAAGGANLGNYVTTWKCVDGSGTTIASGTGSTGTFTVPAASGANVTCTFTNTPKFPAILLDKTASSVNDLDGNGQDAGDTITYSFLVTNTGQVSLDPVTVSDPKLGAITCPTGALTAGASRSCTNKTYTLTQADIDTGKVDNTATASGTSPTGVVVTSPDTVSTTVTPSPAVELDKTPSAISDNDSNGHDAGDTITYGFKVTNTGNVTLNPVTVHDPLFGGTSPNVTCPTGAVAPGASITCTSKTYTLTQADVNAGKVDNTATATGTAPSGVKVTDPDSTTSSIATVPAIELDKTGSAVNDLDGNGPDAGDTVTYGFKVTNIGNVTLNPVTVHDPLFGGTSPNITCPSGAVLPGASITCTGKTYTLTQADVDAGKVDNTATATGTAPGGAKVTDPDSVSTIVGRTPAVEIDKTAGALNDLDGNGADAGDTITFGFLVTNTGNVTLNPVTVDDPKLGGAIACGTGVLAPGASRTCTPKTYTLTQADVNAGKVDNTATVTGTTTLGTTVTDSDSTTSPLGATPGIELNKTVSAISDVDGNGVDAGDTLTYAFTVKNVGNVTLNPVTVHDPLFGGTSPNVTCPTGPLAPGASVTCTSKTYTLTQAKVDAGTVANTATATGTPPTGPNVTADDSTTTTIPATPVIELDKTAGVLNDVDGNGPDLGDTITYGFKVTNTGNVTLNPVTVHDPLFGGTSPNVTCPTGPVVPGASITCTGRTYTLTQADVNAGTVDNTATATGTAPSGTKVTDPDSTSTPVPPHADIALDKSASAISDVDGNGHDAGDTITYTFEVTNTGNVTLNPVTVADPKVGPVTCPGGALAPGASRACTPKTYTLTQADVEASEIRNTATVTGTTPGGGTVTDDDSTLTTIAVEPSIELDKTAGAVTDVDGNGPDAGDKVTYGFKVKNIGNVTLNPVTVHDPLFGGTSPNITCPTGAVAPGASITCTSKTYTLTQADVDAGKVDNTATATGTSPNGTEVTDPDSTSTPIAAHPGIELVKTASAINDLNGNGTDAGDTITYSFEVTNTGNVTLTDLVLGDPKIGPVTCPSAPLAPGASVACSPRTYSITEADVTAGQVHNTATVRGTAPDGEEVEDDDSTTTPITPAPPSKSNIRVTKSVDDTSPRVGDVVTYTLVVTNDGPAAADDVVLKDVLPPGVTFVSADAPCTLAGSTVTCAFGTLAAGASKTVTIQAKVNALPPAGAGDQHWIDVQKTEAQLDLEPGQQRTMTVSCMSGYVMTDGSGRIDHVDQDTGTLASPRILESRAVGLDTWQMTAVNQATGRAQLKVFGLCVKQQTEVVNGHSHALQVGGVVTETKPIGAGQTTSTLTCNPGQVPIQPGYQLDGTANVPTSYPSGATGWTFAVSAGADGTATTGTFTIRCLDRALTTAAGHSHNLRLDEIMQSVVVQPGQVAEITLSCAADAKGIVAGYDLDHGLVNLGNDPRPIVRVFKLYNPTSGPLGARLWLLCLGNRTTGGEGTATVVNTASATTSTAETTTADNSDSAQFVIDSSAPPAGFASLAAPTVTVMSGAKSQASVQCAAGARACQGTAVLMASKTQKLNGVVVRKGAVLAKATYRIAAGRKVMVVLKSTATGRKALGSASLKSAKLKIAGTTKVVRIRH
ncbi:hypothetical protein NSZ01_38510 [Nocardioides szechwanensis]|nr:hypothetical protein NSZ01_38510 [Nocardioides szechwanensis]